MVFLISVLLVTKATLKELPLSLTSPPLPPSQATLKELPHMLCVAPGIFPASMVL